MASLPSGYNPLFFGSAVLADGKVVVQGGEYNCPGGNCSADWQSAGALYDPAANTWTATTAPASSNIGDAQSVVLPNGTWMLAECCAIAFGNSSFPVYYTFNESTRSFTTKSNANDGKNDDFDEEGWNLLPNGNVLTVGCLHQQYAAHGHEFGNVQFHNQQMVDCWQHDRTTVGFGLQNRYRQLRGWAGGIASEWHRNRYRRQRLLCGPHCDLHYHHRKVEQGT